MSPLRGFGVLSSNMFYNNVTPTGFYGLSSKNTMGGLCLKIALCALCAYIVPLAVKKTPRLNRHFLTQNIQKQCIELYIVGHEFPINGYSLGFPVRPRNQIMLSQLDTQI